MLAYVIKRLIAIPFLLLGVASVSFMLSQMTKGDPLAALVPERMMSNTEVVAAVKAEWGLDKPLPVRYAAYLGNLVQGDLGTSFATRRPVAADIAQRLPATLELVVCAMIVGTTLGLSLGLLSAKYRGSVVDSLARMVALVGSSLPIFWSGLILLYLFSVRLSIVPGTGRLPARVDPPPDVTGFYTIDSLIAGDLSLFLQSIAHLALPAFVLGWAVTGIITRLVRSSLIEGMAQDYARTARAKGAPEHVVLINHALPNAMIPLLTILGFTFAYLITGAVLTEAIFSWPGIGSYAVRAASSLDYPAIGGVTIVGSVAFLLANLLTDIGYAWANPRIRVH
ncbi:ABC transporter permease [Hwanghaeella grinnelliae]|uniref:ABC transporter permease n=1 Tax=Hwanghaeella grinnelliae TaxID=2500179 RepID=A0A437QV48_9PROT|nr:ABC transporter permease [Hwanghaeella grinnelliae]RVU38392.1 ABC transporter permease [Hwanghaeella grinnelliae]